MCAMQAQRREDPGSLHERVGSASPRQSINVHPYSPIMSATSNDGARTSSSSTTAPTSAANLAALVPPSMRTRTSTASGERRYSDSSESSSSSRRRKRTAALLPLTNKGSSESIETGTGYRSQSPPRHSPSNLSPPRERRRGSSLSDVSESTVEDDVSTTPPAVSITSNNRTVRASDYAPLPEVVGGEDGAARASPTQPKLARPRFGHEPVTVPQAPTATSAEGADSVGLAAATPQSSTAATVPSERTSMSHTSTPTPPPSTAMATEHTTPVTVPLNDVAAPAAATSTPASAASTPHRLPDSPASASDVPSSVEETTTTTAAPPSAATAAADSPHRPLPPPPLRHGAPPAMSNPPPIAPRGVHSATASDAEARSEDTGFTPLPELPQEGGPQRRHDRTQSLRTATPEHVKAGNRARSARRPTQSVQTARARAQQRRTAASSSPHSRGTPVTQQPDFFPGAKRLDDDRVPLSTKLILGTACVVGVALVFYLGRSVYRYASVNIMEPTPPVPTSKFARARMPKKVVVTDKEAAKIARGIRDRIVANMQSAVQVNDEA